MNKWLPRLAALAIAVYFLHFAAGAVRAHFAADDMENMYHYWNRGLLGNLWDDVRFWSTTYRPMGGLFYLPLYYGFKLNPLPYRIAILLILAVNTYLSYRVAELVTESKATAALTAALVCAQANMIALYYATSFIYDVFTYFFSLLMLFVYIRIRSRNLIPTTVQSVLVVCLYIAALNSKEIAVVGAGWILAYEFLVPRPRQLRLPLILMAVGLIYTAGKVFGPNALIHVDGYTMEFSVARYVINNTLYWNDIWYANFFDSGFKLAISWVLGGLLCWELRKPQLWWCWFVASTATLPISFELMGRGGASLYLPYFGFVLLATTFLALVVQRPALRWCIAGLLAVGFAYQTLLYWRPRIQPSLDSQRLTWSVLTQLRGLPARPAKNSRVIFLNNPFADWDPYFISALVWNDHTIHLDLANKMPSSPTPAEIETYDWVLAFDGDQLRVVRSR